MIGEKAKSLPTNSIVNKILYTCGCFYEPGELPVFTTEPRKLSSSSYAGYAQGTYKITDRLSVTLGARYSHEKKKLDGKILLLDANLQPTDIVVGTGANRDSWNTFTYRAGLEYQATSDLMAYGSIASGFKSGGFNVRGAPELPNMGFTSFKPETALTFEIGLRSEWLDRRLRLNATLFPNQLSGYPASPADVYLRHFHDPHRERRESADTRRRSGACGDPSRRD